MPRDAVSRTAHVGMVGKNGLIGMPHGRLLGLIIIIIPCYNNSEVLTAKFFDFCMHSFLIIDRFNLSAESFSDKLASAKTPC